LFNSVHQMNGIDTQIFCYSPSAGVATSDPTLANRAGFFGDGVFETMVYTEGRIRFAKEHEERLQLGLQTLKINPSGLSIGQLGEFLRAQYTNKKALRVRWNVFRSGLGKYTPTNHDARDLILVQGLDKLIKIKDRAYISDTIAIPSSPWSHCKTLNSLPYVMANIERKELGMDEVIMLDNKGFVSEAGSANIFWLKENAFYTPSLACNCISGVGRRKIIEALAKAGHPLIEGRFTVEELLGAHQVFTSKVTGIAYIAKIGHRSYSTAPISDLERVFV
jgi:4-amino-4-deoxychorismate lyase